MKKSKPNQGGMKESFKAAGLEIVELGGGSWTVSSDRSWRKGDLPVVVVGVVHGLIAKDGFGYQEFSNMEEALRVFPDLDIENGGERFTHAMRGESGGKTALRFETWKANKIYSR